MTLFNPANADVGATLYLASPYGWHDYAISEWVVVRKTPRGQVVCRRGDRELRLTPSGRIVGKDTWSRERFVSAEEAAELQAEAKVRASWRMVVKAAEALERAARNQDAAEAKNALAQIAQGMAAATAGETRSGSTEGNSPVGEADAPKGGAA